MNEEQSRNNPPPVVEVVSKEEWSEWLMIPATKIFRDLLRKRLRERTEDWIGGHFVTEMRNAKAIGEVGVLQAILNLTADEVNEGMSDE